MKIFCAFIVVGFLLVNTNAATFHQDASEIEKKLFANYNRFHRPVRNASTPTIVSAFLIINHISEVNEQQETMTLNGILNSLWVDEYLDGSIITASDQVEYLSVVPERLWSPSYFCVNSASGNNNPFARREAVIYPSRENRSRVRMSTDVSLKVTCNFEFSTYPYDTQSCPIIIRTAMYKADEVHFEFLLKNSGYVSLNFDPDRVNAGKPTEQTKTVVAGWQITGISSKLIATGYYYNRTLNSYVWQKIDVTKRPADLQANLINLNSYIEFWIEMRRYRSYFGITHILPALITSSFTCVSLIVKPFSSAALLSTSNILLQSLFSIELLKSIPPSTGGLPGIVCFYGANLLTSFLCFLLISVLNLVEQSGKKEFDSQFMKMLANFIVITSNAVTGVAQMLAVTIRLFPAKDPPTASEKPADSSDEGPPASNGGSADPDLIPKAPPRQRAKVDTKVDQVPQLCNVIRGLCFFVVTLAYVVCDMVWL